jgi:hypothetical protein
MSDLIWVKWYATILRQDLFAAEVAKAAPIALHYGATQYRVQVDNDDRYRITQMTWVPDHESWYSYWEGPEMIEFRARWMGKYQVPITYAWVSEIAVGGQDAEIFRDSGERDPNPDNEPATSATDSF